MSHNNLIAVNFSFFTIGFSDIIAMGEELEFVVLPLVQVKEDGSEIDMNLLRDICSKGLDKNPPEDRLLAWITLCGVMPAQPEEWKSHRVKLVAQYKEFIEMFEVKDYESKEFGNSTCVTDFGLPDGSGNKLMETIHGDVIRTGHHIFFIPFADVRESPEEDDLLMPFHYHIRRIERILYIFANCNRTLSYMQGFNEIVTVLYCVFAHGIVYFNYDWLELETMVFYMFQRMMAVTKLIELFTTQDQSSIIHWRMKMFMKLLQRHLPHAYDIIVKHNIHPLHFCFRKMNLLFAQDHEMPGVVLIWDALFAHFPDIVEFESYIMVGNVKILEDLLSEDDYTQTMVALQKLKLCDAKKLLECANQFWESDHPTHNHVK